MEDRSQCQPALLPARGRAFDTIGSPAARVAAAGPPTTRVAAALGRHFTQQVPLAHPLPLLVEPFIAGTRYSTSPLPRSID
jgi:hypothetical protein